MLDFRRKQKIMDVIFFRDGHSFGFPFIFLNKGDRCSKKGPALKP